MFVENPGSDGMYAVADGMHVEDGDDSMHIEDGDDSIDRPRSWRATIDKFIAAQSASPYILSHSSRDLHTPRRSETHTRVRNAFR